MGFLTVFRSFRFRTPRIAGVLFASLPLLLLLACRSPWLSAKEKRDPCSAHPAPEGMVCIPEGEFLRGSDAPSLDEESGRMVKDEGPAARIWIDAFYMDRYEVTYSEYQRCVAAGSCGRAGPAYKGYDGPRMPMVGANWFHARQYCQWRGKRLPTEAEWEKAARGTGGDLYPWGNEPAICQQAIIQERGKKGCGTGKTWDVGSRSAYRYGLFDMAGNSWEWVNDWYAESYAACGQACMGRNPKGPCGGADQCPGHEKRVLKGGSWWWDAPFARGSNRRPHFPRNRPYHHYGFRCAKSLPDSSADAS